ncbi:MAG: YIP1 family protein [Methanomethylovorans sp.]|uniref:YIP1 family protein n=1 Tax=Methanomethylovorans sp. TaxID=2758717 RepID=UPI0035310659
MLEVLTNPGEFFENKMKQEADFKPPIMIVGIMAIISAISAYIIANTIVGSLQGDAATFVQIGAIIGAIFVIIVVFIMWVIYGGIFYLISMIFSGQGNFKRVLEFVAYGFLPSILGSLISLILTSRAYSSLDFSITDPTILEKTLLSDPYIMASSIIGIILTLWSANIWVFAMMHSRNLTVKNAIITVGIPIGLYLIYTVYNLYHALS